MGSLIDLTGRRFGRLFVVGRVENDGRGESRWTCKCDCGNETAVLGSHLRNARIVSCGYYGKEVTSNRAKAMRANPGFKEPHLVHGGSSTRLFTTWTNMKTRCLNPRNKAYKWYGGRGICICESWVVSFENFRRWANASGYDDSLTIDRIDPNGDYCPENCRWMSIQDQQRNRRKNALNSRKLF